MKFESEVERILANGSRNTVNKPFTRRTTHELTQLCGITHPIRMCTAELCSITHLAKIHTDELLIITHMLKMCITELYYIDHPAEMGIAVL